MKNKIILAITIISMISCQQKNSNSNKTKTTAIKNERKINQNKKVIENLDEILSPFEDMTEYALDNNKSEILKSLSKISEIDKKEFFKKYLTVIGNQLLIVKLDQLKDLIKKEDFEAIAIASSDIFEMNINNFKDGQLIKNQIQIEQLDYMGFKVLALLKSKNIEWIKVDQTINETQKTWSSLNPKIKDTNLKNSFAYLFEGLVLGAKNKDIKICKILSNMDLSLVDVLENTI